MSCGKPVEDDEEMPQAPIKRPIKCLRCKEMNVVIPPGLTYCQPCQFTSMELKFKRHIASLSTADCPRDSSALVAYTGSPESQALVLLLQDWLKNAIVTNEKQPKHLLTSFQAVHFYDPAHRQEAEDLAQSYADQHDGPLILAPLSDIFRGPRTLVVKDLDALDLPAHIVQQETESTPEDKLRALLDPLSPTSRASLVSQMRLQLLARRAQEGGHRALLMGATSTRLASLTLANIALGRGFSLGEEVASIYRHSSDVIVLRPLASFLSHEIDFLVKVRLSLDQKQLQQLSRGYKKDNIDGLIQNFVQNLQNNFPATVSTIGRTSEKLGLRSSLKTADTTDGSVTRCALCRLPSDAAAYEWPKTNSITDLTLVTDGPMSVKAADGEEQRSLLAPHLCYGCLVSLSERTKAPKKMRQEVPMPEWMNAYMISDEEEESGSGS